MQTERGVTFLEIIAASVIGSLLAGGTLMAFVLSAKITRESVTMVEATAYAGQTIERFRNRIACDDAWFDEGTAGCGFTGVDPQLPVTDTPDSLPAPTIPLTSALMGLTPDRQYRVQAADCDGDSQVGDCYAVTVTVSWNPPS